EERIEQNEQLASEQLELNQSLPRDRSGEKEGDFGRTEGQHSSLHSEDPAPGDGAEEGKRSDQLENPRICRHGCRTRRTLAHNGEPEISQAEQECCEVAGTSELPELSRNAVTGGSPGEIPEHADHGWPASSSWPMSARKTSSSLRERRAGRSARISAMLPNATARPRCITRTLVQISSTRCSRCELKITAVPAAARRMIVLFIRRMPTGSSPVSGSSSSSALGSCRSPHAMASFCFMPRDNSPGRACCLSERSSSASRPGIRALTSPRR